MFAAAFNGLLQQNRHMSRRCCRRRTVDSEIFRNSATPAIVNNCIVWLESVGIFFKEQYRSANTIADGQYNPIIIWWRVHRSIVLTPPAGHRLGVFTRQVFALTSGSAQQQLPISVLSTIKIDLPPLDLQKQFALTAKRYERLRATHVEAFRQADHLFQTLLCQAFSPQ